MSNDKITRIPVEYRRPALLTPAEIHAIPDPSDAMVWELCPYLRPGLSCAACPSTEHDEDYGEVKRGCRGMAEEACKVVVAMQAKEAVRALEPSRPPGDAPQVSANIPDRGR